MTRVKAKSPMRKSPMRKSTNRKYSPKKFAPTKVDTNGADDNTTGLSTDNSTTTFIKDVETITKLNGTQMGLGFLFIISISAIVLVSLSLTGLISFDKLTVEGDSTFKGDVTVDGKIHANTFGKIQFHEQEQDNTILDNTNLFIIDQEHPTKKITITLPETKPGKEIDVLYKKSYGIFGDKGWNFETLNGVSLEGGIMCGTSVGLSATATNHDSYFVHSINLNNYIKNTILHIPGTVLNGSRLKFECLNNGLWNVSGTIGLNSEKTDRFGNVPLFLPN